MFEGLRFTLCRLAEQRNQPNREIWVLMFVSSAFTAILHPSSSRISLRMAAAASSPGSIFPPGSSHLPPMDLEVGRFATSIFSSLSIIAQTTLIMSPSYVNSCKESLRRTRRVPYEGYGSPKLRSPGIRDNPPSNRRDRKKAAILGRKISDFRPYMPSIYGVSETGWVHTLGGRVR